MSGGTPLLSVTDLVKHYPKRGGSFVHRQVGTAILDATAGHTVERDFKKLLFYSLTEAERPPFNLSR